MRRLGILHPVRPQPSAQSLVNLGWLATDYSALASGCFQNLSDPSAGTTRPRRPLAFSAAIRTLSRRASSRLRDSLTPAQAAPQRKSKRQSGCIAQFLALVATGLNPSLAAGSADSQADARSGRLVNRPQQMRTDLGKAQQSGCPIRDRGKDPGLRPGPGQQESEEADLGQ